MQMVVKLKELINILGNTLTDMKKIELSEEDYEFLKELQKELNTQPNDGNAEPLYWGVIETKEVGVPEGCGEPKIYFGDGDYGDTKEACRLIEDYFQYHDDSIKDDWAEIDKEDMTELVNFAQEHYHWDDWRIVYLDEKQSLAEDTGAFLTKKACKEYIGRFGYNYSKPRTYAMTAYRNNEYGTLLRILKSLIFTES